MTTSQTLQGKVAFIQGGSRGIGAAIVKRLAADGAAVAFTYVSSAERANALASEVTSAGVKALALKADSADAAAVQQAIRAAVEHFGALDPARESPHGCLVECRAANESRSPALEEEKTALKKAVSGLTLPLCYRGLNGCSAFTFFMFSDGASIRWMSSMVK